jgi:hypothetical protein
MFHVYKQTGLIWRLFYLTSGSTGDNFSLFADSRNLTGRFVSQWKHFSEPLRSILLCFSNMQTALPMHMA